MDLQSAAPVSTFRRRRHTNPAAISTTDLVLFRRMMSRIVSDFKYDWILREVGFRLTGRHFSSAPPTGTLRYGRIPTKELRDGDACEFRRRVEAAPQPLVLGEKLAMGPWEAATFKRWGDREGVVVLVTADGTATLTLTAGSNGRGTTATVFVF